MRTPALVACCLLVSLVPDRSTVAQATQSAGYTRRCGGSSFMGAAAGTGLGAFLGIVAAKIKLSDWTDATHTAASSRTFNDITLGGAVLGAVVGSLAVRSCSHPRLGYAEAQDPLRRPITAEEIAQSGVDGTLYDVIYALRRTWLNTRGSILGIEVYLDQFPAGDLAALHNISAAGVSGVRYYDPAEATYRWGTDHAQGVIQVFTVRDPGSSP